MVFFGMLFSGICEKGKFQGFEKTIIRERDVSGKLYEIAEEKGIVLLTITREEVLNALNFELLKNLKKEFTRFVENDDFKVLIITGKGDRAFCAGADIKELRGRHILKEKDDMNMGQEVFNILDNAGKPSIAAINGYALGGGLELALSCTFRIASPNARLGLPEINLGIIPGYGGTQRLVRLIGQARALEMILLGKTVTAEEAFGFGLVNKVVKREDLMSECFHLAEEIIGKSPIAVKLAMEAIIRGGDLPLKDGLAFEAALGTIAYNTQDAEEGLSAFLEKRKPRFTGK